ncbi:unnamed protein product [Boreogadus saida]
MVENAGRLTTLRNTLDYTPTPQYRTRTEPQLQPPPSVRSGSKLWQPLPRDTTKSLVLLRSWLAQQASQDLTPEQTSQYLALKQAILAYYGHSLAAWAQRFHD